MAMRNYISASILKILEQQIETLCIIVAKELSLLP